MRDEAFTHVEGHKKFAELHQSSSVFPYLLVNIGSGVSIIKASQPSLRPAPGPREVSQFQGPRFGGQHHQGKPALSGPCPGTGPLTESQA